MNAAHTQNDVLIKVWQTQAQPLLCAARTLHAHSLHVSSNWRWLADLLIHSSGGGVLVAQKHRGHAPGEVVQDLVAAGEGLPVADAAGGAGSSLLLLLLLLVLLL